MSVTLNPDGLQPGDWQSDITFCHCFEKAQTSEWATNVPIKSDAAVSWPRKVKLTIRGKL